METSIIQNLPSHSKKSVVLSMTTKKIRQYTPQDFKDLNLELIAISQFIGLTDPPPVEVRKELIAFLLEHFSDFSREEIKRAVRLAVSRKMNLKFSPDGEDGLKHYNKLTPQYLSNILLSYQDFIGAEVARYKQEVERCRIEQETHKTQDQKRAIVFKAGIKRFDSYKADGVLEDPYSTTFLFLVEEGKIQLDNSKEKRMERFQYAKGQYLEKLKRGAGDDEQKGAIGKKIEEVRKGGRTHEIIKMARHLALKKFFDTLIENKAHLKDCFK